MRILHLCLACFYVDNYNYQENLLPRKNKEHGHEVKIIASTETFIDNRTLGYVMPSQYVTEFGIPIKRIPYSKWLPHFIMKKLRYYSGLYKNIEAFRPDIVMMHDASFGSVKDVVRYIKKHPQAILYADTHTDSNNSGTNWASLNLLHRMFYRCLIQEVLPYIKTYFYISKECKSFSQRIYGIPESIMEFYPLGGEIVSSDDRAINNAKIRNKHNLTAEHIVFVHSGKIDALKRTEELIKAFSSVNDKRFRLFLIGSISDELKPVLGPLIQADKRVSFLEWKSGEELKEYLCACDLYLQPGSQSSSMQIATCCGTPSMLYTHSSYYDFDEGNIFFVKTIEEMKEVFFSISQNSQQLDEMKRKAMQVAICKLDYTSLAARLYS